MISGELSISNPPHSCHSEHCAAMEESDQVSTGKDSSHALGMTVFGAVCFASLRLCDSCSISQHNIKHRHARRNAVRDLL